jgi:hypothetical protein
MFVQHSLYRSHPILVVQVAAKLYIATELEVSVVLTFYQHTLLLNFTVTLIYLKPH